MFLKIYIDGFRYQWWPDEKNQAKMSDVKGFAMQSRDIGPSDLKPFDTKMLGAINKGKKGGVYRLPCENCEALMPFYDIKAEDYNSTMKVIPDKMGEPT